MTLSKVEGDALLVLARAAIEDRLLRDGSLARAKATLTLTPALVEKRACFVTLHIDAGSGRLPLRGCVGSYEAKLPAHEGVASVALEAAFEDPRFLPLTREELLRVVLSVSVLTPIVAIEDADAIVTGRDGVVLDCGGRRALFLPEVAPDHGWTRDRLLCELAQKAGLPPDAWRRSKLGTFRTERFSEPGVGTARIPRP